MQVPVYIVESMHRLRRRRPHPLRRLRRGHGRPCWCRRRLAHPLYIANSIHATRFCTQVFLLKLVCLPVASLNLTSNHAGNEGNESHEGHEGHETDLKNTCSNSSANQSHLPTC